jgi:hypothetical protein
VTDIDIERGTMRVRVQYGAVQGYFVASGAKNVGVIVNQEKE